MSEPDCPYPGLRPFREAEAKFFCGRSQHRIELLTKLEESRFVAVVGASGSGKSSLVMAGLLCDIADGMLMQVPQGKSRVVYFKPGLRPFASLASALSEKIGADVREVDRVLRRSALGFGNALELFDPQGKDAYVVVADQFEELFRFAALSKEETATKEFQQGRHEAPLLDGVQNEAQAFVDLLLEATKDARRPVFVILTMRSDFLHRCEAFDRLPTMISAHQYLTPRLQRDQQADAIAVPLKYFQISIDPALVNLILNDLSPEQDQLPVLQHALARIWLEAHERGGHELTINDYKAIGGIANALNEHGEIILRKVSSDSEGRLGEAEIGRFFTCLAEYDPAGALVRRPRTIVQVADESGLPPDDVRVIADCFRADFTHWLMPMVDEKKPRLDDNDVLDLTHESLLRKWDRLAARPGRITHWEKTPTRGWMKIEQDRRDSLLRFKDRMIEAGWNKDGAPLRGPDLVKMALSPSVRVPITYFQLSHQANALRDPAPPTPTWGRRYGWSTPAVRLFLRIVMLRLVLFWAIVGGMLVGVLLFLAVEERKRRGIEATAALKEAINAQVIVAAEERTAASEKQSESLVAELKEAKQTIEQVQNRLRRRDKIVEAANALTSGLPASPFADLRQLLKADGYVSETVVTPPTEPAQFLSRAVAIQAHEKAVEAVAFLEIDGVLHLASGAQDYTTKLWNLDLTSPPRSISTHDTSSLTTDGKSVVIAGADSYCSVWSPPDRLQDMKLVDLDENEGVVSGQIVSDGRVLFGTTAGRIGFWRPGEKQPAFLPTQNRSTVNAINYFAPREWALSSSDNGLVALWSLKATPPRVLAERAYKAPVHAASIDLSGKWALIPAALKDIELVRIDAAGDKAITAGDVYSLSHQDPVVIGRFSPGGDLIATADSRGRIYLWSLASIVNAKDRKGPAPVILSGHSKRVTAMRWDPNGRCLASADEGGTILLWQDPNQRAATENDRLPFVLPGHQAAVRALTISADGLFIATGGADKMVRVAPFYPTFAGRYRRSFGGPYDKEMTGGGDLALFDQSNLASRTDLFLSETELAAKGLPDAEIAKLGTAGRLKEDQPYVAARWDYSLTSRSFLRTTKVKVSNPKTGKAVWAQPVDWGPNASTGAVADLSPGLAKALGLSPGDPVEIVVEILTLPEPNTPPSAE